jgi:hypothetical protein
MKKVEENGKVFFYIDDEGNPYLFMFWEEKISSCQHVILNVDTLNLNFTCQFLSRYGMPSS